LIALAPTKAAARSIGDQPLMVVAEYICADLSIGPSLFPCNQAADTIHFAGEFWQQTECRRGFPLVSLRWIAGETPVSLRSFFGLENLPLSRGIIFERFPFWQTFLHFKA
jgi:hypothetical protein